MFESVDAVDDMAGFEVEAADALNMFCLDVWCEGRLVFDFQKLSCRKGANDMECTLNLKVIENVRSKNKLEINSVLCVLKGVPEISFPATGDEVYDYVVDGGLAEMVGETCIMGVHRQYETISKKVILSNG